MRYCNGQIVLTRTIGLFILTPMATIPISDAKAKLPMLVREVAASGQAYIISVNGRPMAELRPFQPEPIPGRFAGSISIEEGAFDPLTGPEADAWGV